MYICNNKKENKKVYKDIIFTLFFICVYSGAAVSQSAFNDVHFFNILAGTP